MKYVLKKDLPLAKAGTEVKISCGWIADIDNNAITKIDEKDITEWLEEVKEPKTIYDLKEGDRYWYLCSMNSVWKQNCISGVKDDYKTSIFITEREAKRNKLLRELATRDKWLPKEGEEYVNHEDDIYHWDDSKSEILWYYQGFIFRDKLEYDKYMTEEAKDLLFKI